VARNRKHSSGCRADGRTARRPVACRRDVDRVVWVDRSPSRFTSGDVIVRGDTGSRSSAVCDDAAWRPTMRTRGNGAATATKTSLSAVCYIVWSLDWLIDWLVGFTSHSIQSRSLRRRFPQANLLAWYGKQTKPDTTKARIHESKETCCNRSKKLKPRLVAIYDIRPGNGAGLLYSERKNISKGRDKEKVKKKRQVGKYTI